METRVEVLKDGVWRDLILSDKSTIKYNAVINRIGKLETREISHTNTFSIPPIYQNRQTLGLNFFNPSDLAKALNIKYEAKYYVEDKLLQFGFVVINNTSNGKININFIDESLSITDKWGTTTYQELLRDKLLPIPSDYATAINEMETYVLNKTQIVPQLTSIATRGHHLALFPHNLNVIGDNFQLDENDNRQDDSFNPYQSRPIFNAKAFLDLITESYGYTPIYDDSIDWDIIEKTYMVSDGLNRSDVENGGIVQNVYNIISFNNPHWISGTTGNPGSARQTTMTFPSNVSITPKSLEATGFPLQAMGGVPGEVLGLNTPAFTWWDKQSLFTPNVSEGNVGELVFRGSMASLVPLLSIYAVYENTAASGYIFEQLTPIDSTDDGQDFSYTIDKSDFDTPTNPNAGGIVGIYCLRSGQNSLDPNMRDMQVTETFLPPDIISYDDDAQYLQDNVDLTHAAPRKTIKSLLSSLMQKEGMLINIDNNSKEIKFFSYGAYEQQKVDGNFSDWSQYLQKYSPFIYNTDYGNSYARKNEIGLSSPYNGNTNFTVLSNQGKESKYKDFTTNFVKNFKDIESVSRILNTNNPYIEYENKGLGLVERGDDIVASGATPFTQVRANGLTQGTFTTLVNIVNVNYTALPNGIEEWYRLVDSAVRVDARFRIPVDIIRNLDLSEPIYVEELGGFYIIEELAEYINGEIPVNVKLIKLIDNLRGLLPDPDTPPPVPSISLSSSAIAPNGFTSFNWTLSNTYSFNNYTPTSATIDAIQVDSNGDPTGLTKTGTINISTTNFTFTFPNPLGAEEGTWRIKITDDQGLESNEETVFVGNIPPPPSVSLLQLLENPLVDDSMAQFQATLNFTPSNTTGSIEAQNIIVNFGNGSVTPINAPVNLTVPNLANGTNTFTLNLPPQSPSTSRYWYITLTVDGIESNDRPFAGGTLPFNVI